MRPIETIDVSRPRTSSATKTAAIAGNLVAAVVLVLLLPIALVIWQNDGYGEMRDSMDRIGAPRLGTEISSRDFVKLAEGFGCRGVRTGALSDLPGVLAEAFAADGPTLVEVRG